MKGYIKYQFSKLRGAVLAILMLSFLLCFYLAASFKPISEGGSSIIKSFIEGSGFISKALAVKFFISPLDRLISLEFCILLPFLLILFLIFAKSRLHSGMNLSGEIAWFRLVPVKKSRFLLCDFFALFIAIMLLHGLILGFNYLLGLLFEAWELNFIKLARLCLINALAFSLLGFFVLVIDYALEENQNTIISVFVLLLAVAAVLALRAVGVKLIDFLDPNSIANDAAAFYKAGIFCAIRIMLLSLVSLIVFNK